MAVKGKVEKLFSKKVTRREFLKKAAVAAAGVGIAGYALNKIISKNAANEAFVGEPLKEPWKWSKECSNYLKLGNAVKCQVCPNQCLLQNGERSFCRSKVNFNGKLYTLSYGNPCAVHVDPVEKKPLFHFLPGTNAFSLGEAGCNFACLNCQNWEISQASPEETANIELFPEEAVKRAIEAKSKSIAYTYSEPTSWYDYMYDCSKLGKEKGLRNLWITNGYMNEKPLRDLCRVINAANVDLKSFSEEIYNKLNSGSLQPVLDTLKILKEEKVWFEVTTLMVPTYVEDLDMVKEMCSWLVKNIGKDYPLHFSRFYPAYKLANLPPTPVKLLEDARKIGMDAGLRYVYIGNVPGKAETTYCPKCGKIVIERKGYSILQNNLQGDNCKFCGEKIEGMWE